MSTVPTFVKSGICVLLGLDPQVRKSEAVAVARLARLKIGGKPCRHCDGEESCISCRGVGVVDIKLDEDALIQLREVYQTSAFIKAQMVWRAAELAYTFPNTISERIEATGIRKAFNFAKGVNEPKGSWNRDLYEINLRNFEAYALALPGPEFHDLNSLSEEAQFQWAFEYLRRTQQAEVLVRDTEEAFLTYVDRSVCA